MDVAPFLLAALDDFSSYVRPLHRNRAKGVSGKDQPHGLNGENHASRNELHYRTDAGLSMMTDEKDTKKRKGCVQKQESRNGIEIRGWLGKRVGTGS